MPSTATRRGFLAGAAGLGAAALARPERAADADADAPALTWSRRYAPTGAAGPAGRALVRDAVPTEDGLALVGLAGGDDYRGWIAAVTASGRDPRHRLIGTAGSALLAGAPAAETGVVAAGVTNAAREISAPDYADPYAVRVGPDGDAAWARTYQPDAPDGRANALVHTGEGHVVAGDVTVGGVERPWAAGLDAHGTATWEWRSVESGRAGDVNAAAVADGVVLGGAAWPADVDDYGRSEAAWVAKLTDEGETAWRWSADGEKGDRVEALAPAGDGGVLALGRRGFAEDDRGVGWLAALDGGEVRWERSYPRDAWNWLHDLAPVGDGYVLIGTREAGPDTDDRGAWLLRVDAEGRRLWEATYGLDASPMTRGFAVRPLSDGGILLGGDQYVDARDRDEGWLAKVGGDPALAPPSGGGFELPALPDWAGPLIAGGALGALGARAAGHLRERARGGDPGAG